MEFKFYLPTKIHFGSGILDNLSEILIPYGKKCFMITTKNTYPLKDLFERIKHQLKEKNIEVYHFDKVVPNPTVEIVENGIDLINNYKADFVLAVGGGSSIDTAKTIALLHNTTINWENIFNTYDDPFGKYEILSNMPLISVPTTAGTGAEVTQAAVISMGDNKNTIFHQSNYSNEAILDPELLLTLPPKLTAATGFDAFCHAFESYINKNSSPLSEIYSLEAMKNIINILPKAVKSPSNLKYREILMLSQLQGGISLSNSGASAPHPLSEIIGGIAHISHGEALALVFPEFIEAFYDENKEKFDTISKILNGNLKDDIIEFLKSIDLYKTKEYYKMTLEQEKLILDCPILKFLPFGSYELFEKILRDAFSR